jgi:hypothetical protein
MTRVASTHPTTPLTTATPADLSGRGSTARKRAARSLVFNQDGDLVRSPGRRPTCVRRRSDDRQRGDGGAVARCVSSPLARI